MAETAEEQVDIFKEAASLRLQLLLAELGDGQDSGDVASIKILADLQENQDKEAAYLMKDLSNKVCFVILFVLKMSHHSSQLKKENKSFCTLVRHCLIL